MPDKAGPQTPYGQSSDVSFTSVNGRTAAVASVQIANKPTSIGDYKGYLTYEQVRRLRIDPTVKLCRKLIVAPALKAGWGVESEAGVPQEIHKAVESTFVPMQSYIIGTAMKGNIDFGFTPFEKTWFYRERKGIYEPRLKHLLQENTEILVEKSTGQYAGLKNYSADTDGGVEYAYLDVQDTLLLYQNVEGTNWYGESDMVAVKPIADKYTRIEDACERYDEKMAGAQWILYYPRGKSYYNGAERDNAEIAEDILKRIQSSGKIMIPRQVSDMVRNLNDLSGGNGYLSAWEITLLESKGVGNSSMIDRLRYLDALKVRALGWPERALLEGQFGTKAEAQTHGDLGITAIDVLRGEITLACNWHLVNHFMRINFGPEYEDMVRLVPNPLTDAMVKYVRDMLTELVTGATPKGQEILTQIDGRVLAERANIPLLPVETQVE